MKKNTIKKSMIDHAKKELCMDENFVNLIIKKECYKKIGPNSRIGTFCDKKVLKEKFSCSYDLTKFNEVDVKNQHIITGFGPTNSPTGGTLSIILRALFFQKFTGIDSTIIISDLGAFNSRNIDFKKINYYTIRFFKFIRALGYRGDLRTHSNYDLFITSSITSKVLTVSDLKQNKEVTENLYGTLGIQGKDFPTFIDANFTIADIILPIIKYRKKRVLVFVGIEEYYFPKLSNIVLKRLGCRFKKTFVGSDVHVSAIFGHLIKGLNGFPKMSKSIPESSINLDDNPLVIKSKILTTNKDDQEIILQMINLVSDWDTQKLKMVYEAYLINGKDWLEYKKEYLKYFLNIKKLWDNTSKNIDDFDVSDFFEK